MVYASMLSSGKKIAILIDPDKHDIQSIELICKIATQSKVDYFFVGGSLISSSVESVVESIKRFTQIPVLLFPGSVIQITDKADGILLLGLLSGRNPEYLISNHVVAAPFLKKSQLEIISTAYILIDGQRVTSVEYMSNTKPIPSNKPEIAVATAIAGEMIGYKLVYLEAGSGAKNPVPKNVIKEVKKNILVPLIVGGGLRSESDIINACNSGADIVVIGSAIERNIENIEKFANIVHNL